MNEQVGQSIWVVKFSTLVKAIKDRQGFHEKGHKPLTLLPTRKQWKPLYRRTGRVWVRKLKSNRNSEVKCRGNYFCKHRKNRKERAKTFTQNFFLV